MREIKFRAWDEVSKKYVYFDKDNTPELLEVENDIRKNNF